MDHIMDKVDSTTLSILQAADIDEALLRTLSQDDLKEVFPDRADFGRRKRLWALIHPEENPPVTAGSVQTSPSPSRSSWSSPEAPTTTALRNTPNQPSPKRTLQLPAPPEYVVYSDSELEQSRKQYLELSLSGREAECVMSKELRCRLIRNTITSMMAILRASELGKTIRYPSKHKLALMAERIVECYPMLQDKDQPVKHRTILRFLHKRMANVQTPKKKQGPIPQRGVPKRRRLNFLPSDDETSSASTMTMGSPSPASDAPAPDDGPDTSEEEGEPQVEDSREAQARHYRTLQKLWKTPKPNQKDVAQLLELEFDARRAYIDSDTLSVEDRPAKVLEAYPCFKQVQHVNDELRRILAKDNHNFMDEVEKRWKDFCAQVQFYGVLKKVIKPPIPLDGVSVEYAIGLIRALPALFPSSSPPPKKLGRDASEALLHILEPSEDPNTYLQKSALPSPVLILDRPCCMIAVGNTPVTTFPEEELHHGLIYLLAYYYTMHLTYPKCLGTLLSVLQTEILQDNIHDRDATSSYKKATGEWKSFVQGN